MASRCRTARASALALAALVLAALVAGCSAGGGDQHAARVGRGADGPVAYGDGRGGRAARDAAAEPDGPLRSRDDAAPRTPTDGPAVEAVIDAPSDRPPALPRLNGFSTSREVGKLLGLQHVALTDAKQLAILKEAGYRLVRTGVTWHDTERTQKGNYDWSRSDANINAALQNGLALVVLIGYGNGLYTPSATWDYCRSFDLSTDGEMTGYVAFANQVIRRYAGKGIVWEFVNEPDTFLYKDDPAKCRAETGKLTSAEKGTLYAKLVGRIAREVRPNFPDEVFATGGLAFGGGSFQNAYIAAGAADRAFDAFGFHEYTVNDEKPKTTWKRGALESALAKAGYAPVVFLNTESGGSGADNFSTTQLDNRWQGFDPDGTLSDLQQAAYMPRTYLYGLWNSSSLYVQHCLPDTMDKVPREAQFGIIDLQGNRKPSFYSTKTLMQQLGGYTLTANLSTVNKASKLDRMLNVHLEFKRGTSLAYAFWAVQDDTGTYPNTRRAAFEVADGTYTLTGMLGEEMGSRTVTNGELELELSEFPIYARRM